MKVLVFCVFFALAQARVTLKDSNVQDLEYPFVRTSFSRLDTRNYTDVVPSQSSLQAKLIRELFNAMKKSGNVSLGDSFIHADMSEFVDKFLLNADNLIRHFNYDPASMPPYHEDMSCNIFWLFPYTGTFDMWDGILDGPATIFRNGDALVTYDTTTRHFCVQVPIGFQKLDISYQFSVDFPWVFSSRGIVQAGVPDLQMIIAIGIDCNTGLIDVDDYRIVDSGHISINFHTFSWMPNWTWNLLINACTALFNGLILDEVQSVVKGTLTTVINLLNTIIGGMLD